MIAYWSLGNLDITIGPSRTVPPMGWSREVRFNMHDDCHLSGSCVRAWKAPLTITGGDLICLVSKHECWQNNSQESQTLLQSSIYLSSAAFRTISSFLR